MKEHGNVSEKEMFSTFNMGVGMMMVVDEADAEGVVEALRAAGETADIIGTIVESKGDSREERVLLDCED